MIRRAGSSLSTRKVTIPVQRIYFCQSKHSHVSHFNAGGFFTPSAQPSPSGSPGPQDHRPQTPKGKREYERVSDQEYNIRVGRAFDLLRATMPDFMRTGLVDYHHSQASQSSGLTLLDVFTFRALRAKTTGEHYSDSDHRSNTADQVYDSAIQFRISPAPPSSTSATSSTEPDLTEEEAASLSFSGRSLYFASAHVLRHTLNILFSAPRVEMKKIRMESRASQPRVDDVLHLRFDFTGQLRMTGQEHTYTLIFRYDFDPDTGRIIRHTVEKVEPAIGRKLWTGIATVWQKLIGHEPSPIPTACHINMRDGCHLQSARKTTTSYAYRHNAERRSDRTFKDGV
ncbi:hypothetical protein CBS101457_003242 [Exobasidium rhododendri]|nr:hypothetical protein CBS101457_003242 [Exobasidium rhododendri]